MPYVLPPLPYAYDALEPYIDERTMRLHHDTHHAAYVDNLNTALADHPALAELSVEGLIGDLGCVPEGIRATVRDNGGGHANHSLFWATMTPHGLAAPQHAEATGVFAEETTRVFGSLDTFQERLTAAALWRAGRVRNRDVHIRLRCREGVRRHGRTPHRTKSSSCVCMTCALSVRRDNRSSLGHGRDGAEGEIFLTAGSVQWPDTVASSAR